MATATAAKGKKKAAKAQAPASPPDDRIRAEAARFEQIKDLHGKLKKADRVLEEAKAQTKAAKTDRDSIYNELLKEIGEPSDLLFKANGPAASAKPATPKSPLDQSETRRLSSDWLKVDESAFNAASLADLGISGSVAEKLEADGVKTGKDLQQFLQSQPPRKINGVGETAKEKLNDACGSFYEKRAKARVESKQSLIDPSKADHVLHEANRQRQITITTYPTATGFYWTSIVRVGKTKRDETIIGPYPTSAEALVQAVAWVRFVVSEVGKELTDKQREEIDAMLAKVGGGSGDKKPEHATVEDELFAEVDTRLKQAGVEAMNGKGQERMRFSVLSRAGGKEIAPGTLLAVSDCEALLTALSKLTDEQVAEAVKN